MKSYVGVAFVLIVIVVALVGFAIFDRTIESKRTAQISEALSSLAVGDILVYRHVTAHPVSNRPYIFYAARLTSISGDACTAAYSRSETINPVQYETAIDETFDRAHARELSCTSIKQNFVPHGEDQTVITEVVRH